MKLIALLSLGIACMAPGTFPQSALSASPVQSEVEAVIAVYGGEQIAWNKVSWEGGEVTYEIRAAFALAGDSCATGRYCAYKGVYFAGNVLSYSACPATYTDFSALAGTVGSISNKRSTGTVRAYAGTTTQATLSPGQAVPSLTGITKITCS